MVCPKRVPSSFASLRVARTVDDEDSANAAATKERSADDWSPPNAAGTSTAKTTPKSSTSPRPQAKAASRGARRLHPVGLRRMADIWNDVWRFLSGEVLGTTASTCARLAASSDPGKGTSPPVRKRVGK